MSPWDAWLLGVGLGVGEPWKVVPVGTRKHTEVFESHITGNRQSSYITGVSDSLTVTSGDAKVSSLGSETSVGPLSETEKLRKISG